MRKIIYALAIGVFASLSITSCTEENVTPTSQDNVDNGGGAGGGESADKPK